MTASTRRTAERAGSRGAPDGAPERTGRSRPGCHVGLGESLTSQPFELGIRAADHVYLARGSTIWAARAPRSGGLRVLSRFTFETDPDDPVTSDVYDVHARGDAVVVTTDSFVHVLRRSPNGVIDRFAPGGRNAFAAELSDRGFVTVGGRTGLTLRPCGALTSCTEAHVSGALEQAIDIAVRGDAVYVVDFGGARRLVSFDLRALPRMTGAVRIPDARGVVRAGEGLVVWSDSGMLHVVDVDGQAPRIAHTLRLFPPMRVRAFGGRVFWIGGDEPGGARVVLVALAGPSGPRVLWDARLPGLADVVGGAERLAIGRFGVRRLELTGC